MDSRARRFAPAGMIPCYLADYEDFPHVVAGQEKLDRGEIAEESFNVAIVEDALQAEALADRSMKGSGRSTTGFTAQHDTLHLEHVFIEDVKTIAG